MVVTCYWKTEHNPGAKDNGWCIIDTEINASETALPTEEIKIKIGGYWKNYVGMQINIGDTWKPVAGLQINIGDVWKTIF